MCSRESIETNVLEFLERILLRTQRKIQNVQPQIHCCWGGGGRRRWLHRLKCSLLSNCRISIFIGASQEFRKHSSLFRQARTLCMTKIQQRYLTLDGLRIIKYTKDFILLLLCPDNIYKLTLNFSQALFSHFL